ncbi:MAG: AAA family ATPase [Chloroflexi bacterium]|nr:AAA family ATPase [Chloroflexota bacterium]
MSKPSPLEILMTEYLPAEEAAAVEGQVARIEEPPPVVALGDLRTPIYGNDPNELLKHRFLYRGGIGLLCGPTGIGKSSLMLQAGMHWAVGKAFFGIQPGDIYQRKGMTILLVQAENDEGDLAEMRDGVLAGCDDLTEEEKARAGRNILIATVTDKSAEAFASVVEALILERGPFDLVMVDPAFAYLGGDSNSQKDVSHFMRELLNPLAHKHGVGVLLAHHTNKPLRGKEKDSWTAGDFAYLGAGSAEWINPARAALALRSIGSDSVFEFRGAKRGKRLRWMDANGCHTNVQYIAHHRDTGVICWRQATPEEVEEVLSQGKGGRRKQYDDFECVHAVLHRPGECQSFYVDLVAGALGCGKETVRKMLKGCTRAGWIAERGDQQFRRYEVTESGRAEAELKPSGRNWTSH